MIRLISLLILTAVSFPLFSQTLNSRGLKMVEKIEVKDYCHSHDKKGKLTDSIYSVFTTVVEFKYDNSKQLKGIRYNKQGINFTSNYPYDTHEKSLTLNNGVLSRKDTENGRDISFDFGYKYVMDGHIVAKREEYNHAHNGTNECMRHDNEYQYLYDDSGIPYLDRIIQKWYLRDAGKKIFEKREGTSYTYQVYERINGNVFHGQGTYWNDQLNAAHFTYDDLTFSDKVNDLNIDLVRVLTYLNWENDLEMLTEWVNVRSEHLLDAYEYGVCQVNYEYDGDNIVSLEVKRCGFLHKRVFITYKN